MWWTTVKPVTIRYLLLFYYSHSLLFLYFLFEWRYDVYCLWNSNSCATKTALYQNVYIKQHVVVLGGWNWADMDSLGSHGALLADKLICWWGWGWCWDGVDRMSLRVGLIVPLWHPLSGPHRRSELAFPRHRVVSMRSGTVEPIRRVCGVFQSQSWRWKSQTDVQLIWITHFWSWSGDPGLNFLVLVWGFWCWGFWFWFSVSSLGLRFLVVIWESGSGPGFLSLVRVCSSGLEFLVWGFWVWSGVCGLRLLVLYDCLTALVTLSSGFWHIRCLQVLLCFGVCPRILRELLNSEDWLWRGIKALFSLQKCKPSRIQTDSLPMEICLCWRGEKRSYLTAHKEERKQISTTPDC